MSSLETRALQESSIIAYYFHIHTKLGEMPRATADPPIVYSKIKAHPIIQARLKIRKW